MADVFNQDDFMRMLARINKEIEDDETGRISEWFERRGILFREVQETALRQVENSVGAEITFAMGIMIGWELHAERMSQDASTESS